ncbi:THAP domain-containing protein, partial [Ooceraea biroi]
VYLITCINERWKLPVGYFLVAGLTAEERAEITRKILEFIAPSGIEVIAFTFDGLPANISMCKVLEANILNNKAFLKHPITGRNIFIFLDAAHMIKLIRNAFASKRILYDANDNEINFQFIENLIKLQEAGCFHLANKVNQKHLQWAKNKMNVKLAAHILSESCAIALEQLLNDKHSDFQGCAATAQFCRMCNNVFDCLNTRSTFSNNFKKPLSNNTAEKIFNFFTEAIEYFSKIKLKINGCFITSTKIKIGFLGFIIDMNNLKNMFHEYVETGYLQYILSYKLSQD